MSYHAVKSLNNGGPDGSDIISAILALIMILLLFILLGC